MKLDYCYHCHTKRCGHATGEDEEYVRRAIDLGIKRLGFSDHVILPEGYSQPGIRGDYSLLEDYLQSIKSLKVKYKDQIEILVGFEAEYFPELVDYYKDLLKNKIDFLILGQHCTFENGSFHWSFPETDPTKYMERYANNVIQGMKTGLFTYLCHPDLFMNHHGIWNETIEKYSREILKACEELNIPIEINMQQWRYGRSDGKYFGYPNVHFFNLAKEYNVKCVIGLDAHEPNAFSERDLEMISDFLARTGIKVEEDYFIK